MNAEQVTRINKLRQMWNQALTQNERESIELAVIAVAIPESIIHPRGKELSKDEQMLNHIKDLRSLWVLADSVPSKKEIEAKMIETVFHRNG